MKQHIHYANQSERCYVFFSLNQASRFLDDGATALGHGRDSRCKIVYWRRLFFVECSSQTIRCFDINRLWLIIFTTIQDKVPFFCINFSKGGFIRPIVHITLLQKLVIRLQLCLHHIYLIRYSFCQYAQNSTRLPLFNGILSIGVLKFFT